jgi:hypothetical protein
LGARPILTSKLVARLDSPKTPWCRWSSISRRGVGDEICYGAWAMSMIGCAGPPTPSKIWTYHTLVAAPAFLAISTIGRSATVLP